MRRLIAATFLSLDGIMQAPGAAEEDPTNGFGYGGWTVPHWDDAMGEAVGETFAEPFDLLLGRKTYEIFAAHWPYAGNDDPVAIAFNAATKHVAAGPDTPLDWARSERLQGDAASAVAALKQGDGPDLLLQGSSDLIQTLLGADLIDEFRLMIFPLVLGSGKRLFGDGTIPAVFRLERSSVSSTGVLMATYIRAGDVQTGSFALAEPTPAELERRARMAREG